MRQTKEHEHPEKPSRAEDHPENHNKHPEHSSTAHDTVHESKKDKPGEKK